MNEMMYSRCLDLGPAPPTGVWLETRRSIPTARHVSRAE